MAGPPTPLFMQATLVFDGVALRHNAVATFGITTPTDLETLNGLASAFGDFHNLASSSSITLRRVEFKQGPESTGPTYPVVVNRAGGRNANTVPPNVSYLVRKIVPGVSGRLHGRAFWPGPAEAEVTADGALDVTLRTNLQAGLEGLYDALTTLTGPPQVFPDGSSDPRAVGAFAIDAIVSTQRRRLRR